MKYRESAFDILYLQFAIISGCVILRRAQNKAERHMGLAALILGCGDAFHLVPRVLNYFADADLTAALGIGKLVTSITMTVFYLLLYDIWLKHYRAQENRRVTYLVWILASIRVALCLFPQNGWMANSSDMTWGIIRNVPFVLLGAEVCRLYFRKRGDDPVFRLVWLYILLSFLFYLPVAVGAGLVPMLGMLMLPKTICYILLITVFLRSVAGNVPRTIKMKEENR
ncbi:MAG: hypothetical protein E7426_00350 [Ruminococcaceae bacterium]|nr:hypothetical protein [Oscillospiraceae bacterium]